MQPLIRSFVMAASATGLVVGLAGPGAAVAGTFYEDVAYAFAAGDTTATYWVPDGSTVAQPFVSKTSGTLSYAVLPMVDVSVDAEVTVTVTDGSAWPRPGAVLASITRAVSVDDEGGFDLSDAGATLTRGSQYVVTLTVDVGEIKKTTLTNSAIGLPSMWGYDPEYDHWGESVGFSMLGVVAVTGYDGDDPTVVMTTTPADPDGLDGWFVTQPTVTITCDDATTRVLDCPEGGVWPDGVHAGEVVVEDAAGHSASTGYFMLKIDTVPPRVRVGSSTKPNRFGWYRDPVQAGVGCWELSTSDPSEVATCEGDQLVVRTTEVAGRGSDEAGNEATDTKVFRVDVNAPSVRIPGLEDGEVLGKEPDLGCKAADGRGASASGVLACRTTVEDLRGRKYRATAVAKDKAGNRSELRVIFFVH